MLKRLIPRAVKRWRFVLAQLEPGERSALLRWTLGQRLRPRDWRRAVGDARRVTFVCHGNIIRSPLAAIAFEHASRMRGVQVVVTSAGVSARPGEAADPRAIASARERGIPIDAHRSSFLGTEDVEAADVIFVMDLANVGRVLGVDPRAASRVYLLGGCDPDGRTRVHEIHDPVLGTLEDVRQAHDEVLAAVRVIAGYGFPGAGEARARGSA